MKKLSGQDALFPHIDRPNAGTHGTMIYIYDQEDVPGGGPLRFKQILAHIERNLDAAPFFRRKIVQLPLSLGYPYWALDDRFDLIFTSVIRHCRNPATGANSASWPRASTPGRSICPVRRGRCTSSKVSTTSTGCPGEALPFSPKV